MVLNASKTNPLDRCKQMSQFIAHGNGFGCIQNQSPRQMPTNYPIYIAHENGFVCIQNQSLDRRKQSSQFIAHETNPYTDENKLADI